MKKFTLLLVLLVISISLISQTPQAFKYQAVVRDDLGELVTNQTVSFRISIHDSIAAGPIQYQETHIVMTDAYGHANLEIGTGDVTIGAFTDVDWKDDDKFLEVELDLEGGDAYFVMGTTQLLAVPYSLYAESTGDTSRWRKNTDDLYYLDGKVGIGTITPEYDIDIYSNSMAASRLRLSNLDYSKSLFFSSGSENFNPSIYFQGGDGLRFMFYDGGYSELMRIQQDGDIGIGTSTPNESAILELNSNSKGFLPSRMTNHDRDAMSNPVAGLFIFNLDENVFQFYNGANWQSMYMAPCIPSQPDTIFGESYPGCNQSGMIYSIDEIPGATNYNWIVPSDATIVSGLGTTSITVDFGTQSGNISVRAENGCGNSEYKDLIVTIGIPSNPGQITGTTHPGCNENGVLYSIVPVPGALNYHWTVPADAVISDGQGTDSITIDFGTQGGNVSVRAENLCGNSAYTDLVIIIAIPSTPASISGKAYPECNQTYVNYYISDVPGATYYNWMVPSNATIVSGQGTKSIYVNFGWIQSGNISVRAENGCGNSNYRDLAVSVGLPSSSGPIYGETQVCCNSTSVEYYVDPVPGATEYIWTIPADATITGGHSSQIRVNFGTQGGEIQLEVWNGCGSSAFDPLNVEVAWGVGCNYAGGIIVYITSPYPDLHGVVCAETDQSINAQWGCIDAPITGSTSIIDGISNTLNIVNNCPEFGTAARICNDLELNGYNDWYLPAIGQLDSAFINLYEFGLGGFSEDWYWSSTKEIGPWVDAFSKHFFEEGEQQTFNRAESFKVRAFRNF